MFEGMKGIAKGGKIAEATSFATQKTINWLIEQGTEAKTHDTLFICRTYYFYAKVISHPISMNQEDKLLKYVGAIEVQAQDLLNKWLTNITGVFGLQEYFEDFDHEYQNFVSQIINENEIADDLLGDQRFNLIKSYAVELVISNFKEYFDFESEEFKQIVGSCCLSIRTKI